MSLFQMLSPPGLEQAVHAFRAQFPFGTIVVADPSGGGASSPYTLTAIRRILFNGRSITVVLGTQTWRQTQ